MPQTINFSSFLGKRSRKNLYKRKRNNGKPPPFFECRGFNWDCYIPINDEYFNRHNSNLLYANPALVIKKYKCPFIKKKLFSADNKTYVLCNDIYNFVKKGTNYDISFIEDFCKKRISGSDSVKALDLLRFTKRERSIQIAISTIFAKYKIENKLLNNATFLNIYRKLTNK